MLSELHQLESNARDAYNSYAFNRGEYRPCLRISTILTICCDKVYQNLVTFTNTTLSAFYFDIVKDSLYADSTTASVKRRKIIWTLQQVSRPLLQSSSPSVAFAFQSSLCPSLDNVMQATPS